MRSTRARPGVGGRLEETAVRRAQELVVRFVPKERRLVDELLEERRLEAARG